MMSQTYITGTTPNPTYYFHTTSGKRPTGDSQINMKKLTKILEFMEATLEEVRGPSREMDIKEARVVTAIFLKKTTNMTLEKIGKYLGDRHHSTVSNMLSKEDEYRKLYPALFNEYFNHE